MRVKPLSRYPYLVFFIECHDRIDVWRVLHGQRDIPAWLADDADLVSRPIKPNATRLNLV
jgi:hypothetical protein